MSDHVFLDYLGVLQNIYDASPSHIAMTPHIIALIDDVLSLNTLQDVKVILENLDGNVNVCIPNYIII